jgi:hypothetical protein
MATVLPGVVFQSTTAITATNLNLLGQPTVSIDDNEVVLGDLAQVATNTLLGRSTTGTGNVEAIDIATSGIGYRTGAGSTVTQGAGSGKGTGFTLSKVCGEITTDNATLNADTTISATWTNTLMANTDVVFINHVSGGTVGAYTFNVACGAATGTLYIRNVTAGNLGEALVLRYVLLKAVTA